MKKLILFFILTLGLFSNSFSQGYGWQLIETPDISGTPDLTDLFFVNDSTGWITTDNRNDIFKTVDGAASFSTQTTPLGATSAIHMLDTINGYSGGDGGWVYKTTDGGINWNLLASMGQLTDISFPPNTDPANPIGYVCGDAGRVWEITSTLTDLNSPSSSTFRGISAPSVNNVWVCGGGRIYYYNGTDFTSQGGPAGTFNDIHFINNQEGWVVGNGGVIGHTIDGGALWVEQINPDPQNLSLNGVFFLGSEGWAVGAYGVILHTTDGGINWMVVAAGVTNDHLSSVHFTSTSNGYVVGNSKTLLKYTEVLGIGDMVEPLKFEIVPNPAGSEFKVQSLPAGKAGPMFKVGGATIEVYDLNGRKMLEKPIPAGSEETTIDVSHLQSGLYFCRIRTEKGSVTKKLIIK